MTRTELIAAHKAASKEFTAKSAELEKAQVELCAIEEALYSVSYTPRIRVRLNEIMAAYRG